MSDERDARTPRPAGEADRSHGKDERRYSPSDVDPQRWVKRLVGLLVAVGLWLLVERTRLGSIIRAGVYDAEMTAGMGINIPVVFTGVFAFGAALGGLSGVIAGPIQSAQPAMGAGILIPALIVVVVGGLGSLKGSLVGSLIIGQAETFGKVWLPGASMLMIYLVMALVVLMRPQGLFGRPLK